MNSGIIWCPHCGKPHALGTKICPLAAKTIERSVHVAPASSSNPLEGTLIGGKYFVQRLIGAGGMGEVFEAENRVLRRLVAVKVASLVGTPDGMARLEREAMLVSAVQHPNICDVLDFGVLPDGRPFMVLERLFGETLAQLLARKIRLDLGAALDIFTQMLSGLQAAHGAHIIHRDLKPKNVFLADRLGCPPLVKLLDFGLARDVSGVRARTITKPGALLGTLKYMSPEQLKIQKLDARSDLFAVGVMLYETLTGKHPFEGPSLADVQVNILRGSQQSLCEARPELPRRLSDIVDRCLAKDPEERWPSAADVLRALARMPPSERFGGEMPPPSSGMG